MKKYWVVFITSWQTNLEYRLNLILQLLGKLVFYFALIILWLAVYKNQEFIGDYSKNQMITYIIGSGIISGYIFYTSIGDNIDAYIKRGLLSPWLTKTINVPNMWFVDDLARRIFNFIVAFIAFLIVLIGFQSYLFIQTDLFMLCAMALTVILAGIINYFIFYLVGIFAFWMDETWGLRFVMRMFLSLAGGSLIPLSLLPGFVGKILLFLPTKYMTYIPMQIYLNKMNMAEIIASIAVEFIWIAVLWFVAKCIWNNGLKHYSAIGG